MKKIAVIFDAYSHGSYHEVINQAYLMMIAELYEKVIYIADKSACDNIRRLLEECNVEYKNVEFHEKNFRETKLRWPGLSYMYKLLYISFLNYWYYLKAPRGADVFYNNNLFFAILLISLFATKDKQIYDMCHNEMELIDKEKSYSGATGFLSLYFRFMFDKVKLHPIFHFILLSPKMVDYFRSFISDKNHGRIFGIDHCYIRPHVSVDERYLVSDVKFKIGIPGAIDKKRGLETLKRIIASLKTERVCIYALSSCSENIESPNFVMLNKGRKLLPFGQYNAYVQSMDAMLLLYDVDSYKLTASGAVLEAIWNEKPILALHNMYFDYLFEKFGKLGELFDSEKAIAHFLNNSSQLDEIEQNCAFAKQQLKPEFVRENLKMIIEYV